MRERAVIRCGRRTRALLLVVCICVLAAAVLPECAAAGPGALFTPASSAPQRARLVRHITLRVTTGSVDLFRIDEALLRQCSTRVFGPNERRLVFHDGRVECGGRHIRLGMLAGDGEATIVIHQGRVAGAIHRGDAVFRVEPVPGGLHALIKVDATRFPAEDAEPHEHRGGYGSGPRPRRKASPVPRPKGGAATAPAQAVDIDVLVAYTRGAADEADDIMGRIHQAMLDANASYRNSDINIRLNLVDSFELPYREGAKPFQQIVDDFASSATVNARRDRSGADVAVLIVNAPGFCRAADAKSVPQQGDLNCCGLGAALMATAATAFSVVHYECALAPNYSFAHEIGHLQGATHDVDGVLPAFRPHGHGFQHTAGPARWRTIMAYDCKPNCPRLPYWSNPRIKRGGVPMGTADGNDNARVLNETAATIAAFRDRPRARKAITP